MRRSALALLAAGALLLAACGDDEQVVHPYDKVAVPAVPDRTQPIPPAADALADGQYWATADGVDGDAVQFVLTQAFFGPTCEAELGADACDGEMGVVDDPSREITVTPVGVSPLTVVNEQRENFAVPADEFVRLVAGEAPSSSAPEGFAYQPFPFLVTVRGGNVVGLQQIWMP
ncbi:MAG: hypothetical protein RL238_1169 [Actinomycetota bacterium]|jgi:hypothetical protein